MDHAYEHDLLLNDVMVEDSLESCVCVWDQQWWCAIVEGEGCDFAER